MEGFGSLQSLLLASSPNISILLSEFSPNISILLSEFSLIFEPISVSIVRPIGAMDELDAPATLCSSSME